MYLCEQLCSTLLSSCVRPHYARTIFIADFTSFFHCRSDPVSSQTLKNGDVVKLHLGAHIDGFASIAAETIVVGATSENPVTGRAADVVKAAWTAAEVAMRLVKVGNKNWAVTEAVSKVAAAFDCKPVEGIPFLAFNAFDYSLC